MFILEDSAHLQHVIALDFLQRKDWKHLVPPLAELSPMNISVSCAGHSTVFLVIGCPAMTCRPQSHSWRPLLLMSRWRMKHTHREIVSLSYLFNGSTVFQCTDPLKEYNDPSQGRIPTKLWAKWRYIFGMGLVQCMGFTNSDMLQNAGQKWSKYKSVSTAMFTLPRHPSSIPCQKNYWVAFIHIPICMIFVSSRNAARGLNGKFDVSWWKKIYREGVGGQVFEYWTSKIFCHIFFRCWCFFGVFTPFACVIIVVLVCYCHLLYFIVVWWWMDQDFAPGGADKSGHGIFNGKGNTHEYPTNSSAGRERPTY